MKVNMLGPSWRDQFDSAKKITKKVKIYNVRLRFPTIDNIQSFKTMVEAKIRTTLSSIISLFTRCIPKINSCFCWYLSLYWILLSIPHWWNWWGPPAFDRDRKQHTGGSHFVFIFFNRSPLSWFLWMSKWRVSHKIRSTSLMMFGGCCWCCWVVWPWPKPHAL